jgi:HEAT repeat protein
VREQAAWALGARDDRTNAAPLAEILASERDRRVRATAAWAIGVMRPATAPRGLIEAVNDADDEVRVRAAWAISEIRDSSALPALRRAMARDDNGERTQRALLRALVRSGESDDRLVGLFDAPDARVREMVARALSGGRGVDVWPWPQPRPRPFP